jgi:hydroxymethylpyrimidine/phosphomethylpyrimidine kinase
MIRNVLSIAGSDPSGGAGIQADLKTFAALSAHGCAVVTALTAQNTRAVTGVHQVPAAFIAQQLDTLFADVRIDAVKIGMIGDAAAGQAIAASLLRHRPPIVVLDPVMVAKSGDRLLAAEAVECIRQLLVPLATVVTPNLDEAAVLLGEPASHDVANMPRLVRALKTLGPAFVYLKGGHLGGDTSPDVVFDGVTLRELPGPRIATKNTHGTGCTLSAAIAALLARGGEPFAAFNAAKDYVSSAIARSGDLDVGTGHGPVHHFHAWWTS